MGNNGTVHLQAALTCLTQTGLHLMTDSPMNQMGKETYAFQHGLNKDLISFVLHNTAYYQD